MNKIVVTAFLLSIFLYTCTSDHLPNPLDSKLKRVLNGISPSGNYESYILPESDDYAGIPQDPSNPLTKEKVELGKLLFYETGLALAPVYEESKKTYSCSTCHVPSAGFLPGRVQGIAEGGIGFGEHGERRTMSGHYVEKELDVQEVRAASIMNVAFVTNTTWNGQFGSNNVNEGTEELWHNDPFTEINFRGYYGLESQAIEGFTLHRMLLNSEVLDTFGYRKMFDAAFPDFPVEERYTETTGAFAISAYLRSLLANRAPFQMWLKGDELAMDDQQKRGALLFFGKAGCFRCHKGPALNNPDLFYAIGVKDLHQTGESFNPSPEGKRNFGRGGFTRKAEDLYKFKIPQLYNLKHTPCYFHGSSKRSLRSVVNYFNEAIPENENVPKEQIAPQFRPLHLTEKEIEDLLVFLGDALYDHDYQRYVPDQVLSGYCFPNNDVASRFDLGCD